MTVYGWDASDFDWDRGPMDLAAAARDGIGFFTHKATESTNVVHTRYGEALRRARDAGIPVLGAYHVVRSPRNPRAEVDYHLAYVDRHTPWWRDWPGWFFQVDLEVWPYDNVPPEEGEDFADLIETLTGRKAIIYASRGQYGNRLAGTSHDLWNANYGPNNPGHYHTLYRQLGGDTGPGWVAYSGRTPVFWQYGSRATIGYQQTCDANAYRGTPDQLFEHISGRPKTGAPDMRMVKPYKNRGDVFVLYGDGQVGHVFGVPQRPGEAAQFDVFKALGVPYVELNLPDGHPVGKWYDNRDPLAHPPQPPLDPARVAAEILAGLDYAKLAAEIARHGGAPVSPAQLAAALTAAVGSLVPPSP